MINMKRTGLLFLSLLLLLGLVACEKKLDVKTEATVVVEEETTLPASVQTEPTEKAAEETTVATTAPLETTKPEETPEVDLVFNDASLLVAELLKRIENKTLTADPNLFEDDAFDDVKLEALEGAVPTVQEILWDEGFLELRLTDGKYVTLELEKQDDGRWLVEEVEESKEFFERDGNVRLEQHGQGAQKKMHFSNLSALPGTQFANDGEYIDISSQGKRVLVFKRWDEGENFHSVIKILELNGSVVPSEIMYKRGNDVTHQERMSESFGLYFYPGEDVLWLDRLADLLGLGK